MMKGKWWIVERIIGAVSAMNAEVISVNPSFIGQGLKVCGQYNLATRATSHVRASRDVLRQQCEDKLLPGNDGIELVEKTAAFFHMLVNEGCGFMRSDRTVFNDPVELKQKESEDAKREIRERGYQSASESPRCEGRMQFIEGKAGQFFVKFVATTWSHVIFANRSHLKM